MIVDDYLTNFQKGLAAPLISFLLKTPITPNQVTLGRFLFLMIPALILFARGDYLSNLVALLLCLFFSFFDYVDGGLARRKKLETELGGWLDPALESVSQFFMLLTIAIGVYSNSREALWLVVGLFALVGHALVTSFYTQYAISFGFHSYKGPQELDTAFLLDKSKVTPLDAALKSIIDQSGFLTAFFFTFRYVVFFGALLNLMQLPLLVIAVTSYIRLIVLFCVYVVTIGENNGGIFLVEKLREIKRARCII